MPIPAPTPNIDLATAYGVLRKALTDQHFRSQLLSNSDVVLAQESIDDPQLRSEISVLLSAVEQGQGAAQSILHAALQEQRDTLAVAQQMKNGLNRTVDQIDKAFRSTMLMYQVTFYLGIALVLVATVSAFTSRGPMLPAVFGSLGTIDVLLFFLKQPQEKLQSSRADLAQLQAALYNWFMDSINQRSLQTLMMQQPPIDVQVFEQISEVIARNTATTLELIQKYCEPTLGRKK